MRFDGGRGRLMRRVVGQFLATARAAVPGSTSRTRLVGLVVLAAAALVAVAAGTAWVPGLGIALERKGEPRSVDAIVLTYGAMMTPSGVAEADQLYRAGWANVVVLSDFHAEERAWDGGHLRPLVRRQLLRRGVPEGALLDLGPLPDNESEEAGVLSDLFAARGWHSALLVVRDYRGRRTVAAINRAAAPGSIDLIPRPVSAWNVDLPRWWATPEGVEAVAGEWTRVVYYRLRGL